MFDQTKFCPFALQTSALPFAVILLLCDSSTLLPIQAFQWISHLSSAHLFFKIQCHLQHWCIYLLIVAVAITVLDQFFQRVLKQLSSSRECHHQLCLEPNMKT